MSTAEETAKLTTDKADEIFRASPHFDQLDDTGGEDDLGFWYYLVDGTFVLIDHSGNLSHGDYLELQGAHGGALPE
jgi:hypothetical protein